MGAFPVTIGHRIRVRDLLPRALLRLWISDPQPGRARARRQGGGLARTHGLGEGTEAVPPPSPPVVDGPERSDGPYHHWGFCFIYTGSKCYSKYCVD